MKMIYRADQNRALNQILIILEALIKHDDIESADAIMAAFEIAGIVGGDKMLKKLEGDRTDENSSLHRSIAYIDSNTWPENVHRRARKVLRRHRSVRRLHR